MRLGLLILAAIYFCSCSAMKLAREYADWYIASEVDDAFALDGEQEQYINKKIDQHLEWADRKLIPELVVYADLVLLVTEKDLETQSVDKLIKKFESLRVMLVKRISPDAAWILSRLSKEQKNTFKEYLIERNEELEEQVALKNKDFKEEIYEKRFDTLEEWFGDLTDKQKESLVAIWPAEKQVYAGWLRQRKLRDSAILNLVNQKEKVIETTLNSWAKDPNGMLPKAEVEKKNEASTQSRGIMARVFNLMNKEQRAYFRKRVNKLKKDFQELAKK